MPLIKSISGIRGTLGGLPGDNLTPPDLVNILAAYSRWIKIQSSNLEGHPKIVIGRDGRSSGPLLHDLVRSVLGLNGIDVLDADLATTPTVEMAVIQKKAQGGIIISASHNPQEWNALKLLNQNGEFLDAATGKEILDLAAATDYKYPPASDFGSWQAYPQALDNHIEAILDLPLVNKSMITKRKFRIVVDGINSVGAKAVPAILEALGVEDIELINGNINGRFAHNPEPLEKNLSGIMSRVKQISADLGIVVDPDVDRLAFIDEKGQMFGEEYTLVAVADYVLHDYRASTYHKISVSNLSSTRALKDLTVERGGAYYAAPVGEVNVVKEMKDKMAVIGGEGNGGVIYPELHYGRDALVGVALFLSYLASLDQSASQLRKRYPNYYMVKDRLDLPPNLDLKEIFSKLAADHAGEQITTNDGLKIDWSDSWVHLRSSNTEPIIRIYAEAAETALALSRANSLKREILSYIK